ncbi:hypothetical protein [Nannocystis bainbridge]|uniref:DUF883 domain-containing protein n=1 Tax=Nannocystis bainbridge TaxID=2995303 RepID=A0ABT5DTZ6_9BACT|nr:hypothetical protein [Nannocystis bainbridge]MDC0716193.1 hypothetical protein [Nannocystis bainbridge]
MKTKEEIELDNALFSLTGQLRAFSSNYENAAWELRRKIVHEVAWTTAAGLVLGGVVGGFIALRRR